MRSRAELVQGLRTQAQIEEIAGRGQNGVDRVPGDAVVGQRLGQPLEDEGCSFTDNRGAVGQSREAL